MGLQASPPAASRVYVAMTIWTQSATVTEQLRSVVAAHARQHGVRLAYLFGSHARGQPHQESDVDVAVLLAAGDDSGRPTVAGEADGRGGQVEARFDHYRSLAAELTVAAGGSPVDLHLLRWPVDGETDGIAAAAVRGVLLHAADEAERVAFETVVLAASFDLAAQHAVRRRYLARRVEHVRMGEGGVDMVDRRVVEERLDYVDTMLRHLKGYRGLSLEAFKADEKTCHAALFELQSALEAVADVATHLVAAMGWRKPEGRAELFQILAEQGVLSEDLAQQLGQAMAMRNIIVHGYLRIALDLVYEAIQRDLGDLEAFSRHVLRFLEQETPPA